MAKKGFPTQTIFKPRNPHKYVGSLDQIVCRSSWERKFANWLDLSPAVVVWNSEDCVIPYWSQADQKQRNYHVDFIAQIIKEDGTTETNLYEIKPYCQSVPPKKTKGKKTETYLKECYTHQVNQDKWTYARAWAEANNMKFVVLDEFDLGIKPLPKDGKKR